MNFEDLKIYLPKFLSAESEKELFEGLKDFPNNIDSRIYTNANLFRDSNTIYQGDGIKEMLVINLPDPEIKPAPGIILSNTCDIDINNERRFSSRMVYAPIFNLNKYKKSLYKDSTKKKDEIDNHIVSIKKQRVTQIFFLPQNGSKIDDSIVFLDRVNNLPVDFIDRNNLRERRIFTLSNYGAYLFLLKLSYHFTRIQDKVDRKSNNSTS